MTVRGLEVAPQRRQRHRESAIAECTQIAREHPPVAAQIHGKTFDTVLGKLIYDDKGDVSNSNYVWYVWKDGKYKQL